MCGFGRVQSQAGDCIEPFEHSTLTVVTDGSEDLLIHCLNAPRPTKES